MNKATKNQAIVKNEAIQAKPSQAEISAIAPTIADKQALAKNLLQLALNKHIVAFMQTHKYNLLLGTKESPIFAQISLKMRKAENGEKRADIAQLAQVLIDGQAVSLQNLNDTDMIQFTLKLAKSGLRTDFNHKLLKLANSDTFAFEDTQTVSSNGEKITLERDSFLGESIDSAKVLTLIKLAVSNAKKGKDIQKWTIKKGVYIVND